MITRFLIAILALRAPLGFAADPNVPGNVPVNVPANVPANVPVDVASLKPPIRVACLGDSITFGVGAAAGWAYPDQLDRMLGPEWDVRNFGHSGATVGKGDKHSIWGTPQYKEALAFHPDVVVILLGTNDTKPENWENKKAFPKLYKELIVSFQKLSSHPRVFCGTAPYVGKKGAFGINEAGVLEQIPMIRQTAAEMGAAVTDVHAALDGHDELFKDNVHPITEGASLIAKAVYASLTGKAYEGAVPDPKSVKKEKPRFASVENPGQLTYREAYGLIVTSGIPADKLGPIKSHFETTVDEVEAKTVDFDGKIAENDSLRMKFKRADPKQAGEYKATESRLRKDEEKYKRDRLVELTALIPPDARGAFGAAWVNKYVLDRLAPVAATLTPEQRQKIRALCAKDGEAYGNIGNTPERSIEDVEVYSRVYAEVLDDGQKRRIEPK